MALAYSLGDWVLLFYIYCFIGWCFETTFVSVFCKHHFVNRGFLYGPLCPIYGCGALLVLFLLRDVSDSLVPLFLSGLTAGMVQREPQTRASFPTPANSQPDSDVDWDFLGE